MSRMIRRAYKFRAYPNKGTRRKLWNALRRAATPVWNACVVEREAMLSEYTRRCETATVGKVQELGRDMDVKEEKALRQEIAKTIKWPTAYDQYSHVRKSDHSEYEPYSSSMLECAVAKVDGSWKSFMAQRKNGDKQAMPPRQTHCCHCLTFRKSGWSWPGGGRETGSQVNKVELMGIGTLGFVKHRDIEGKIKTVSVTHERTGEWAISFSCEVTIFPGACGPLPAPKSCFAQDLQQEYTPSGGDDPEKGGTHNALFSRFLVPAGGDDPEKADTCTLHFGNGFFLRDSDGREVQRPEFYETEITTLRRLSRTKSRRQPQPGQKASRNYRKAKRALAKWHVHIARKRDAFLWSWARFYASNYRQVIVPQWPLKKKIQYALESHTAMKLCDGAYGRFLTMLRQKCEEFGTEIIEHKEETYDQEVKLLDRVAGNEKERKLIRKVKKAVRYGNHKAFKSLNRQCKQLLHEGA